MIKSSLSPFIRPFIRLFGIKYAEDLKNCTCSMSEIAELAKIGVNYHAEISKGIRLAKYVKIK